jgi:hypothetical protein
MRSPQASVGTFPFGRPLESSKPGAKGPRRLFLLGAYPSALHIRWTPPPGHGRRVQALAVDNEPEPFWDGADQEERVAEWRQAVGWGAHLGQAAGPGGLNGSTGRAIDDDVLTPLGVARTDAWLTDCLDTYHLSVGMAEAIREVYDPLAQSLGLPGEDLPGHPGTEEIVRRAQRDRLDAELEEAAPRIVVTLGQAALEVFRELVGRAEGPERLSSTEEYGQPVAVTTAAGPAVWYPLVHPGQRNLEWRDAHKRWVRAMALRDQE